MYSEVAAYEFTTLTTVPGCIKYKVRCLQQKYFVTWLDEMQGCFEYMTCDWFREPKFSCLTSPGSLKEQRTERVEEDRCELE